MADYLFQYLNMPIPVEVTDVSQSERKIEHIWKYFAHVSWYKWKTCEIMHGNKKVAVIQSNGICRIHEPDLMPYNLYLEEADETADMDIRLQNKENFNYWCASRMIPMTRSYSKEILNSINVSHQETDRDRAAAALAYHCLSLTDIFWTKAVSESLDFNKLNLYQNRIGNIYINTLLLGESEVIEDPYMIARTLGTQGDFPKVWIESGDDLYLMKGGPQHAVKNEILASRICQCFRVNQVIYEENTYEGQAVSLCKIMSSMEHSIVSMEYVTVWLENQGQNVLDFVLDLDAYSYYMMNIIDYLVGNTDRHWGNWGMLVDNSTNMPIRLHDLMDFNRAFGKYDTTEGAACLTLERGIKMSQKEAAIEAVKKVGVNQIAEIEEDWFDNIDKKDMFNARLNLLKGIAKNAL